MSLIRSWFPNRSKRSEYELPMWNSILPTALSPAAAVAGMHMPSTAAAQMRRSDTPSDDLFMLQKKEELLQETLQELLDAQADGLLAGLGNAPTDDISSAGNLTPTTQSMRSLSLSPTPQGARRKLGLGPARRAIWKTILECAAVKEQQDAIIHDGIEENHAILEELGHWDSRGKELRKQMHTLEGEDTAAKSQSLQTEADTLQQEITDTEQRLARMRTRHRQLINEISDLDNSVQSKLSSYKSSLAMLEKDVETFLAKPPIRTSLTTRKDDSIFITLPPKRRTLEMAKDYWEEEYTTLKRHRKAIMKDRTALEQGAIIWKNTIAEITLFEKFLQKESKNLAAMQGKGKSRANTSSPAADPADIISRMESTLSTIQDNFKVAQSRKWRLLEVCIGAELETFIQAKEMLEATFFESQRQDSHSQSGLENWMEDSQHGGLGFEQDDDEDGDVPGELLEGHHEGDLVDVDDEGQDTSNDDPSADLMVSRRVDESD
ncbi:hypothetical protein EJ08DRAFT_644422 [Tothia fuscella]|uniref:Atg28p n=1 Tax=Tothia fuscella TaxID=1048955 RepID=A0A9P4P5D4_9PEZI|nr:hypothetical protein EJ08DRAFT_644422 [Tothia fuscella]